MDRPILPLLVLLAFVPPLLAQEAPDPDTDGDGLSDFQERHKYFTNPALADSDGDGIPDGAWDERREYAYTVRTVLQVLPPVTPDVVCDDYQDARILESAGGIVELEAIHYPLNTVAEGIVADRDWRKGAAQLAEFLEPGLTANWNPAMRKELLAGLRADGIDVKALDDRAAVERTAKWLLGRARFADGFTTFCSTFPDGKASILPGLESAAEEGKKESGLSIEEQWERELFAEGMFRNRARGSCTSTAIYLNGGLRAAGIPTRIVLCVPIVDASDGREVDLVRKRIRHAGVRRAVLGAAERLGTSWASHTFNEVFVGGRWRRLNDERLGQNTFDPGLFGLMTHVATFRDWADGEMARTWGLRQALRPDDVLGGSNPYSAISVSDRFGEHSGLEPDLPEDPEEHRTLTIERAYGWDSPERQVDMRLDDPGSAGHFLVHVREFRRGEGTGQYKSFYDRVDKAFVLRAEGRADVPARAARGYWVDEAKGVREFYLRVEPRDFDRMVEGVPYRLHARNGVEGFRWEVREGVVVVREG